MLKVYLSVPYFRARDAERRKELDLCVRMNVANDAISRIFLFVDDGCSPPVADEKLVVTPIERRLTYRDWLEFAETFEEEHIALLANTDIYFDETLRRLNDLLRRFDRLVALSRFDLQNGGLKPHPRPQWSQDAWALNSRSEITEQLKKAADFPLGVPRCDNKVVYEFAVHGWDLINPFPAVRAIHVHESNIRAYDKEQDRTLIGGMGFIRPQSDLSSDSKIELTVWPRKSSNVTHLRLVDALEQWDNRAETVRRQEPIIALDRYWQYPAITEQWAFQRMRKAKRLIPEACAYLAFPWATLFDKLANDRVGARAIEDELAKLAPAIRRCQRVATVCQHIRLLKYQRIFYECGVTDIFWSHCTKDLDRLPEHPSVRLHAFPLYPVQVPSEVFAGGSRLRLFSFIGARAQSFYLAPTRNHIIDALADDPRGLIVARDEWHYNKIVYDHQIKRKAADPDRLIDDAASAEYRQALVESVFSLCPSGSGPNSIRLWESIGAGAIPVILADTYAPPGDPALWREAAVFAEESLDAIRTLPERLEQIAADMQLLDRKRHALRQLWRLYGPDWFVHDIERFFLSAAEHGALDGYALPTSDAELLARVDAAAQSPGGDDAAFLLNAVTSRMLLDAPSFCPAWRNEPKLAEVCEKIAEHAPEGGLARSFNSARRLFDDQIRRTAPKPRRRKLKVFRLGRNSVRTPIAYEAYAPHFAQHFDPAPTARDADVVVFGASPNIAEHGEEVLFLATQRPNPRFVVLSEEPLWDTTWSKDIFWPRKTADVLDHRIDYAVLNHFTSSIFDFERIPYFLTTDDRFFQRYSHLFRRNALLKPKDLLDRWMRAKWRAVFYAEKRREEILDFQTPDKALYGLCAYRTRVAEAVGDNCVLRAGQGWSSAPRRQDLPDWHLDKIAVIDRRSFIVSGLENTHYPNYVTEKIFDAYAVQGVPLYYAGGSHRIREIVNDASYLNLFGTTAPEAAETIGAFEPDIAFAEAYVDAQKRLSLIFSEPASLFSERKRVAAETARALENICAD